MAEEFKPNIYPIMYWSLIYGLSAGVILFLLSVLSRYITLIWFPVFLAGLVWGGYRNYQRQRQEWEHAHGVTKGPVSPMDEFKAATRDVVAASRELITQQEERPSVEPAARDNVPPPVPPPPPPPKPL
jgi:hypothetical protein